MQLQVIMKVLAYWYQYPSLNFFSMLQQLERALEQESSRIGDRSPAESWNAEVLDKRLSELL